MTKGDDKPDRFLMHLKPLQGALEAFCRRGLYDPSLAEDVLQETVARAFRDFGLFSEGTNFRAWIFKYVNLGILEANRRHRRDDHRELDAEPAVDEPWKLNPDESLLQVLLESPEMVLEQCDDDLNRAVCRLRPTDRAVLLLKAIGEFKYREIAEIVGIPLGTVMSSLARARQQMRYELTRGGDGPGRPPSQSEEGSP